MASNLFERIFANVDSALATYIADTVGNVIGFAAPLFTSMMIVFIAMWGYMMMFGRVQEPLQDGVFRIIRIGLILTLGLTIGNYMGIIVPFLRDGPEYISGVVTGSTGTTASTLDSLFGKIFDVAKAAWDKGGVMNGNFGLYLIALIVLVVGGALVLYVAFLVMLATFMLTILLGIGPLFIIALLFNVTQRFFEAWIAMVANFGMLLILSASVGSLMITLADSFVDQMAPNPTAAQALANLGDASLLCLVFALCILVVRQVPSVSAALGGGIALATQGAVGAAMNAMRPSTMRRGVQGMRNDASALGRGLSAPLRGAQSMRAGYQKRFGANSIGGF